MDAKTTGQREIELDVQAIAHAALDKIAKAASARRGVRLDAVECGALAITVCERS